MRRRITFAILGTVAAALLLAGLGTLALNRVTARNSAERDLRDQASASAALLETGTRPLGTGTAARERVLARTKDALHLADANLVLLDRQDVPLPGGDPIPEGINLSPEQFAALGEGAVVSGSRGNEVYAAAPVDHPQTPNVAPVLFLTRSVAPAIGAGVGWFLLASAFTLLLGALIAARLSRRLTKPLVEATQATARIAVLGDLAVRLPEHERVARGSGDELDALAHSINEMADSLERSRGLERQFLLSVSHDLRTPLTSIRGYAEAIADGVAAPDDQAAAGVILAESRRLERLVRDLLDLAKLEGRQFSLDLGPVELGDAVAEAADGFRREVVDAGLRLELRRPDEPVWATADVDRLAQVLANLVENALKYAATTISVSVATDGGAARLEVADDGPGIAAQDLPHVFERLYVAGHEPKRKEVGSGLGLAIVRELVEAMGGSVRAEASVGGGARMVVSLPPAQPSTPPQPGPFAPGPPTGVPTSPPPAPPTAAPHGGLPPVPPAFVPPPTPPPPSRQT